MWMQDRGLFDQHYRSLHPGKLELASPTPEEEDSIEPLSTQDSDPCHKESKKQHGGRSSDINAKTKQKHNDDLRSGSRSEIQLYDSGIGWGHNSSSEVALSHPASELPQGILNQHIQTEQKCSLQLNVATASKPTLTNELVASSVAQPHRDPAPRRPHMGRQITPCGFERSHSYQATSFHFDGAHPLGPDVICREDSVVITNNFIDSSCSRFEEDASARRNQDNRQGAENFWLAPSNEAQHNSPQPELSDMDFSDDEEDELEEVEPDFSWDPERTTVEARENFRGRSW